jgi:hypothetical protein
MATEHQGVVTADDPENQVAVKPDVASSAKWGTVACGAGLFSDGYLNAVSTRDTRLAAQQLMAAR